MMRPLESAPFVSVIVPVRNEERHLSRCLESILAQEYPRERLEIVIVENGSTDDTVSVAEGFARRDARIRLLISQARNQAEAMNVGIRAARGDIVARVDGHSYLGAGYLCGVVDALRRYPDAVGVGGPFLPAGETLMERVAGRARSSPIGVGGGYGSDRKTEDHPVATVQCGGYWRAALLEIGLFDVDMAYGEDEELNWRFVRSGRVVMLCPGLAQYYRPRGSLRALARQYWNYGQGRLRVVRKHPDFLRAKHLVPSAFVVGLPLLGMAALFGGAASFVAGGIASLYAALLIGAGAVEAGRGGWREAWLVPAAIFCMHAGYGSGMLWGMIQQGISRRRAARSAATTGERCRA